MNIPCKECICLPTCIGVYKKATVGIKYSTIRKTCPTLKEIDTVYNYDLYTEVSAWWRNNYL